MEFFGMGFFEILIIMVVALLVVGPDKLPEYARKFGKVVRDIRKMTGNFTGEVTRSLDLDGEVDELKRTAQEMRGALDEESLKIKNALDLEAEEIARTVDTEVSGVKKTLDEGTEELAAMLEKESTEFNKTAREMKTSLDGEAREINSTLNAGIKDVKAALTVSDPGPEKTVKAAPTGKNAVTPQEHLETAMRENIEDADALQKVKAGSANKAGTEETGK
jgi:Tat protein translocase TatB subunit